MKTKKHFKVALVHDYLAEYGGAERVLEALHEIFPEAPVYTAFVDLKRLGVEWQKFAKFDIRQTWLSKVPLHKKLFSPLRIFAPQFFRSLDLSAYDLVISSTNAYFAKAVRVSNGKHFCYCHTPSRSLWGYNTQTDWQSNPVTKFLGALINHYLRIEDVKIARSNVDHFIANSHETARRITKFYKLPSTVIYPPVNIPLQPPDIKQARTYYLYVNRLAWAKHPELAVQVCSQLKLPLKVVGAGKMLSQLKKIAGPTVQFLGHVKDQELCKLYRGAIGLIYPVEDEDFGIVPVEAMAYGVPVIAHYSGGPKESVIEGKTGVFFQNLTARDLKEALERFQIKKFNPALLNKHAQNFSKAVFQAKIKALLKVR